jgi:cation transport ATPase
MNNESTRNRDPVCGMDISADTRHWVEMAMASPIVLWGGWPILVRGWRSVATWNLNMSGEPIPVEKAEGDRLIGATINATGSLVMEAEKVGADTVLSQISTRMLRTCDPFVLIPLIRGDRRSP